MDTSSCKKLPFDSEYLHTDLYYRQSSTTVGNNAVGVLIKWKKAERQGNPVTVKFISVRGSFRRYRGKEEIRWNIVYWKKMNSKNI